MPFAAGLSEHPITAVAVGEVVGQVLEGLGPHAAPPDLAVIFVTAAHAGALEDAASTVYAALGPRALVGCAAETVVGGEREVEAEAAVSLWAGHTGPVTPFHLRLESTPDGATLVGWPDPVPATPAALLLLADPFSFPADAFLARAAEDFPHLPVVGGMASAAQGPGGNRLAIDKRVVDKGAIGVFLGPDVDVITVVSQGCRPVGEPSRSRRPNATSSTSARAAPRSNACRTSHVALPTRIASCSAKACTSAASSMSSSRPTSGATS